MKYRYAIVMALIMVIVLSGQNLSLSSDGPTIGIQLVDAADGDNWLTDFTYREKMNYYEQSGAGTNYQVKITVYHDSGDGVDGVGAVCLEGNGQVDFDDVRFTDYTGDTELDYWREEYTASVSATFWIEVTDDLGTYGRTYIYYGNAGASTTSDGEATFIFFDNFNDGTIDTAKWDQHTGTSVEENGYLELDGTDHIVSDDTHTAGVAVGGRVYFKTVRVIVGFVNVADWWNDALFFGSQGDYQYSREDTSVTTDAYTFTDETWQVLSIDWYSGDLTKGFEDYGLITTVSSNVPSDAMSVYFYTYASDDELLRVDWTYVRKVIVSEPYMNSVSAEEQAVPVNSDWTLDNPDDTDNLYARYKKYEVTGTLSSVAGYGVLDTLKLYFEDSGGIDLWAFVYDVDSDTFSETM